MEEAAKELGDRGVIAEVDCTQNQDICDTNGVDSYPTIKYFTPGKKSGSLYNGERSVKDFVAYVIEKKSFVNEIVEPSTRVVELDEDNFESYASNGTLIKFFTPFVYFSVLIVSLVGVDIVSE